MVDYMITAIAGGGQVRILAAVTRELVEVAREAHNTSPVATAALGRLLTAGAMMGTMLKGDRDIITLQISGDGPIGGVLVTADSKGGVKGYVKEPCVLIPASDRGKLDVSGAIGKGELRIIKDLGLKEPYVGTVPLVSGEIGEDLTYYYANSEQISTSVGLGVLMDRETCTVKRAGGFIIQALPYANDDVLDRVEGNVEKISSVTGMLEEGLMPEDIARLLAEGLDIEILDSTELKFYCNCDKNRVKKALASIGKQDIEEIISDGEDTEVRCHFCNSSYIFSVEELKEILGL